MTAGNASQISDGAAALVVASEAVARQHNSPIKARIIATATSGVAPKELFIAPVSAIEKVLAKAKLKVSGHRFDRAERSICGAVFGVYVAVGVGLGEDERPRRSDCAGASDWRERGAGVGDAAVCAEKKNLRRGLAALCLGGGNAVAMIVEREI